MQKLLLRGRENSARCVGKSEKQLHRMLLIEVKDDEANP